MDKNFDKTQHNDELDAIMAEKKAIIAKQEQEERYYDSDVCDVISNKRVMWNFVIPDDESFDTFEKRTDAYNNCCDLMYKFFKYELAYNRLQIKYCDDIANSEHTSKLFDLMYEPDLMTEKDAQHIDTLEDLDMRSTAILLVDKKCRETLKELKDAIGEYEKALEADVIKTTNEWIG